MNQLTRVTSETAPDGPRTLFVGIGASAGGLDALKELLSRLTNVTNVCCIVAQHLSPSHVSILTKLLSPVTSLAVLEIVDGVKAAPRTIYITPSNKDVELRDGALHLVPIDRQIGPKPSVDHLFSSMARDVGEHAVAVVLSGTGSDGSEGVRAIKAAGGVVIVQSLNDAAYDGMPRAAVATGCTDIVDTAPAIAAAICKLASQDRNHPSGDVGAKDIRSGLQRICDVLRKKAGFETSHMKDATLMRRIERRRQMHGKPTLLDYALFLEDTPEEIRRLARDLLITVTEFFRDAEAFSVLRKQLENLIENRGAGDVIRIWVAGCATGEEAYTLAMVMREIQRSRDFAPKFLIFATDIEESSLEHAKSGVYTPLALADLPPEMRERYFSLEDGNWIANKDLRQYIVFSRHNLLEDAPFSRLNLVSCRNVLIYFKQQPQQRVMELFHYALEEGGLMMMGKSESVDPQDELFEPVNKKAHLFRRKIGPRPARVPLGASNFARTRNLKPEQPKKEAKTLTRRDQRKYDISMAVMREAGPPTVVINDQNRVLFTLGSVNRILDFPEGEIDYSIFQLLPKAMTAELRGTIQNVRRRQHPALIPVNGTADLRASMRARVFCMEIDGENLIGISFIELDRPDVSGALSATDRQQRLTDQMVIEELERDLDVTRAHLQTVAEELETSNEELQTTNEQLQSTNEELQSSNEELQTSNEELQSSNEELRTLNEELEHKSDALQDLASSLTALKESLSAPLLLLDEHLQIQHLNAATARVANLRTYKRGFGLASLDWKFPIGPMIELARDTLSSGKVSDLVIEAEGEHYLVRITRTVDPSRQPLAVTLAFTEISAQRQAEAEARHTASLLRAERDRMSTTLASIGDGVISVDADLRINFINPQAATVLGWSQEEALGQPVDLVYRMMHEGDAAPPSNAVRLCVESGEPVISTESDPVVVGRSGRRLMVTESAAPLRDEAGNISGAVLVFRDDSDKLLMNQELLFRATHDSLTHLVNRYEFERQLRSAIELSRLRDITHSLAVFDLDNFKVVNDTCGHDAGDELLRRVTQEVQSTLRAADLFARLGGDEFAVLMRNCPLEKGIEIAARIRDRVRSLQFVVHDRSFQIGASIGICEINSDDAGIAPAIGRADFACYEAKRLGKNQVFALQPDSRPPAASRDTKGILSALKDSLQRNSFVLVTEPIVAVAEQARIPVYREVLLRLPIDDGKLMMPGEFLPVAERYGQMPLIDLWVANAVVHHLEGLQAEGKLGAEVWAVNVSASSLNDREFCRRISSLLKSRPAASARLCFEITETIAIAEIASVSRFINQMRGLGCRFALDDFGTGAATFGYLKKIQFDYLKIDRSFIIDADTDSVDQTMIESVCRVARSQNILTIAEGVEHEALLPILDRLGVQFAQGYAMGRSVPLELAPTLRSWSIAATVEEHGEATVKVASRKRSASAPDRRASSSKKTTSSPGKN